MGNTKSNWTDRRSFGVEGAKTISKDDVKKFITSPHASKFKRALLHVNAQTILRLSNKKLYFVHTNTVINWLNKISLELPRTCDIVVGIPRSGLFLATYMGERLNLPLSTPELLAKGLYWEVSGIDGNEYLKSDKSFHHVLLIDDSVNYGTAIKDSRDAICSKFPEIKFTKIVLFALKDGAKHADFIMETVGIINKVCEWSLTSRYRGYIASDLDGVICEDGPMDKLADAKPLFVPSYPLVAIITDRLEKYREETQRWLNKNNVKYDRLFMSPNAESTALHKIEVLRKLRPPMYIESDEALAEKIWKASGVPTLCYKTMKFYS
jgi:adenine/guanine phosphoribosyltransferase-like PRPP-binding protein